MDKEPLLYNLPPTAAQVRNAWSIALLIMVSFAASIPFARVDLTRVYAFIPVVNTALLLSDGIVATLFLSEALVLRSKALMALGTGYFFTSLIIIPHGLTYPGAFSSAGLLGATLNSANWLYYFWHCGLPVSVIAYAQLKQSPSWSYAASPSPHTAMAICLIFVAALVVAITLLATVGDSLLPQMMLDSIHGNTKKVIEPAILVGLLVTVAMAMTWRARTSVLDLWLLLALGAWLADLLLSMIAHSRFSFGWYSGRILGLLAGLFALLMLLANTSRLYARTVLQVKARQWERENRIMFRDAVGASIAHELRQPLGAIMLNIQVAQTHNPKPDAFISSILDDISSAGQRANDIIENTRAIFGKASLQMNPANINQLIRDTLAVISQDLRRLRVSVDLRLGDLPHPVTVNRLQMEQVFYNLFMNAAEAMSTVADKPRILTIFSYSDEKGVVIAVEDTGPGIAAADQERIFEMFQTTKDHGMGLGLSICRSVVTAHGGQLRVIARAPRGALFEVHLPYSGSAETVSCPPSDAKFDAGDLGQSALPRNVYGST